MMQVTISKLPPHKALPVHSISKPYGDKHGVQFHAHRGETWLEEIGENVASL